MASLLASELEFESETEAGESKEEIIEVSVILLLAKSIDRPPAQTLTIDTKTMKDAAPPASLMVRQSIWEVTASVVFD